MGTVHQLPNRRPAIEDEQETYFRFFRTDNVANFTIVPPFPAVAMTIYCDFSGANQLNIQTDGSVALLSLIPANLANGPWTIPLPESHSFKFICNNSFNVGVMFYRKLPNVLQ